MSTPTMIRHSVIDDITHVVLTYFEGDNLRGVYQQYRFNSDTGRTVLLVTQPYLTEQGAVLEWQSAQWSTSA